AEIQRVVLEKLTWLPVTLLCDVIEVVEVLGEAPPRVARVVEEVRPDDVTADSPSRRAAGVEHALCADRDLVDAPDLERRMVKARPLRGEEREVVVIRRAAEQRDDGARSVG